MKKLLILTGKFGMGHYSAANTLAQQAAAKFPDAQITVLDIFAYISPNHHQNLYRFFHKIVGRGGNLYNLHYQIGEHCSKEIRPPFLPLLLKRYEKLIAETQPDVVISTLPAASQLTCAYKRKSGSSLPLITCITDISTHREWINEGTNCYMVGSPEMKTELIAKGIWSEQIRVSGIPVKQDFLNPHPNYGFSCRHLLIMGGGLGLMPNDDHFYQKLNALPNVKTTVITGNNQKLFTQLNGNYSNIEVVGFTDQVAEYMQKADLLLSKPGGITTFEAIHSGLPLFVFQPFLEQEIKNAHFIERYGLGRVIYQKESQLLEELQQTLMDLDCLNKIRIQMAEFRKVLETDALACILERTPNSSVYDISANNCYFPGLAKA